MAFVSKSDLQAQIAALQNSKAAFLPRLQSLQASFATLGEVTDVTRDGVITHFTVGGDVMRVTVDAMADQVVLVPVKLGNQLSSVTIPLDNSAVDVDFTPKAARQVYDTYELFDRGPKPSGEEIAAGLNGHLAR